VDNHEYHRHHDDSHFYNDQHFLVEHVPHVDDANSNDSDNDIATVCLDVERCLSLQGLS